MDTENNGQGVEKKRTRDTVLKSLVIIGIVVLLVVGILLPIKVVPNAVSGVAATLRSIFIPKEEIILKVNKTSIETGEEIVLSWNESPREDGTYSLSYMCVEGLRLEQKISSSESQQSITCEAPFFFTPENGEAERSSQATLIVHSDKTRLVTANVSVDFKKENANDADALGDVSVIINNRNTLATATTTPSVTVTTPSTKPIEPKPAQPAKPAPVTPSPSTGGTGSTTKPNLNTKPDLAIRIQGVGRIAPNSDLFIPTSEIRSGERAAIKFEVINLGDKTSGAWKFNATLPTIRTNSKFFQSGSQQSLAPGDRIEFTLAFDDMVNIRTNVATVTIDPASAISESNENNNILAVTFTNIDAGSGTFQVDLSAKILQIGSMDRNTNVFTSRTSLYQGERGAVKFEVRNNGSVDSGSFKYTVAFPGSSGGYTSDFEPSIKAGSKVTYTIGFDVTGNNYSNTVTVTADSSNTISESNESNNTSYSTVTVY